MLRVLLIAVALSVTCLGAPASAGSVSWDVAVKALCTSTSQNDCWVKSGAAMCGTPAGERCTPLPDNAPAQIIGRANATWQVVTSFGTGWVFGRDMMLDQTAIDRVQRQDFPVVDVEANCRQWMTSEVNYGECVRREQSAYDACRDVWPLLSDEGRKAVRFWEPASKASLGMKNPAFYQNLYTAVSVQLERQRLASPAPTFRY